MRLIPRSRAGMLWRSLLAAVVVIAFAAATTAVAGLLQVRQITQALNVTPAIKALTQVTVPNPGSAQTILLVGSDHRAGTPLKDVNTDTMMLVRLDPNSKTINLLSVPRDLKVQIPEGGAIVTNKLNAAYFYGGPNLLIKVLQQQVFPGLKVNHVVDVGFGGFEKMINAIGCVYTDVDHRYYNNTAVTDYSSIDIQPGYQKLCGNNQSSSGALAFVRFRHTDTDIVRNARQQDFVRWAKSQFNSSTLVSQRDRLLRIFGKNSQTDQDLHTTDGLINIFNLVAFSAGHTVKQIPFPAIEAPCTPASCYVLADRGPLQHAFHLFMTPTQQPAKPAGPPKAGPHKPPPPQNVNANLSPNVDGGKGQVSALGNIAIPVYFPKMLANGSQYCSGTLGNCPAEIPTTGSYPRGYLIHNQDGGTNVSYRMTVALDPSQGEYYGVQGTTWQHPPILNGSQVTKTVGGKQLHEYFNGSKVTLVAWRTPQAVYWISNTLTDTLSGPQMLGIAASLTRG
jgi:LCP family protein required for cell wall assembly